MMTVQTDHRWPTSPSGHMWSRWMDKRAREGVNPPTQYPDLCPPRLWGQRGP